MTLRSKRLAAPFLVASALALAGFVATQAAQAGMPPQPETGRCAADLNILCPNCPVTTITGSGGGGNPNVDAIVTHAVTGQHADGGDADAGMFDLCSGSAFEVRVFDTSGTPPHDVTSEDIAINASGCSGENDDPCTGVMPVPGEGVLQYTAGSEEQQPPSPKPGSGGPTDVDEITLRPRGEVPTVGVCDPFNQVGTNICVLDSSGTSCNGPGVCTGAPVPCTPEDEVECGVCAVGQNLCTSAADCTGGPDRCVKNALGTCTFPIPCTDVFGSTDCPFPGTTCRAKSRIDVQSAEFTLPIPLFGSTFVACGPEGANGKAPCSCGLVEVFPIPIPGVGLVCVLPSGTPCDVGELECDGGNVLDTDLVSDHNIGTCTDTDDCEAQCDAVCGAAGTCLTSGPNKNTCQGGAFPGADCATDADCVSVNVDSGCEGFCTLSNRPCTQDAQCAFAFEGSCTGPEPPRLPHTGICGCQCGDADAGTTASRAGAIACNLGANINVMPEGGTCADSPIIVIGDSCIGVTTEKSNSLIANANNIGVCVGGTRDGNIEPCDTIASCPGGGCVLLGATIGPVSQLGTPTGPISGHDCDAFTCNGGARAGEGCLTDADCPGLMPSGASILGEVNFFDSGLGDILVSLMTTCGPLP